MLQVEHYGLHYLEGVAVLVQERGVSHALGVDVEYQARLSRRGVQKQCPHNIHLPFSRPPKPELPEDPLFRQFLPIPKTPDEPTYSMRDTPENRAIIQQMLRLTSPIQNNQLAPAWLYSEAVLYAMLRLTNVQPLIIYAGDQFRRSVATRVNLLLDAANYLPRRLLLLEGELELMMRSNTIEPTLSASDLSAMPLEEWGAAALYHHMLINRS